MTTSFYGKGVALAGMKTACGAALIASQFLDTVAFASGASAAQSDKKADSGAVSNTRSHQANGLASKTAAVAATSLAYDLQFKVKGASGASRDDQNA